MEKALKILYQKGEGELVEKKSRFIARLCPVNTEEEALAAIEEVRRTYRDASHHCYAYVIGEQHNLQRMSDDGEPSQTAGRPILDVLLGEDIHNALAVVTRYFGGTLLGTGGLVRAYTGAVKEALNHATVLIRRPAVKLSIRVPYPAVSNLKYRFDKQELDILDQIYAQDVTLILLAPDEQVEDIRKDVMELTKGEAFIKEEGKVCYGVLNGEKILFKI